MVTSLARKRGTAKRDPMLRTTGPGHDFSSCHASFIS